MDWGVKMEIPTNNLHVKKILLKNRNSRYIASDIYYNDEYDDVYDDVYDDTYDDTYDDE